MSFLRPQHASLFGRLKAGVRVKVLRALTVCAVFATAVMSSSAAMAATGGVTINNRLQEWNSWFNQGGRFALNAFMLIGIGIAGFGIMEMKRAGDANNQGRDSHKSGFIKLLCGGALASLTGGISLASSTIFGSGGGNNNVSVGTAQFGG